jgi:hypothetical protein
LALHHLILSSTLLPEEKQWVWAMGRAHADEIHCTTLTHLEEATVIPTEESHWNYQTSDRTLRDQMVTYLVAGLKKSAQKVVNFDKLREIQQETEQNPASFLSWLTEALDAIQKLTLKLRMGQLFL